MQSFAVPYGDRGWEGSSSGVGYLILEAEGTFDIETVLAGVILLTSFALTLDFCITLIENALLKWQAK